MTAHIDPSVLANDPERRRTVVSLLEAALAAADPERAVDRVLQREGTVLQVDGSEIDLAEVATVRIIAIGKAAAAMTRAAVRKLHGTPYLGLAVSDHEEPVPDGIVMRVGGHPIPDAASLDAGRDAVVLAGRASEDDLVMILISGGGSALCELPADGLQLEDLQVVNELLIRGGAGIKDINAVRKHLSLFKGGRLAEAAARTRLLTLVMSDVVGNPLDVIASGPTVPDSSTYRDAVGILSQFDEEDVPERVSNLLAAGARGEYDETPDEGHPRQLIATVASGATAAYAVETVAEGMGLATCIATTSLKGEAREAALKALDRAEVGVTVYVGETTVTVTGTGKGGRNQEAALAAAIEIQGRDDVVFAAFATDGVDGPTDAAGAIVDGSTIARGEAAGLGADGYLSNNDSHRFLDAVGDLIRTGYTGTNVGDVWVVLRSEE